MHNIVKGLNKAGFSEKDYKMSNEDIIIDDGQQNSNQQFTIFPDSANTADDITSDIDTNRIYLPSEIISSNNTIDEIEQIALQGNEDYEQTVSKMEENNLSALPIEMQQLVNSYGMKKIFKEKAEQIQLPQFFLKIPANDLFGNRE